MRKVPLIKYGALVMALSLFGTTGFALKKISIEPRPDTTYLPFKLIEIQSSNRGVFSKPQLRPAQVGRVNIDGRHEGLMVRGYNPALNIDNPANFTSITYPTLKTEDDDPVRLIVNDWRLYTDKIINLTAVVGAGYKNDTAWVFKRILSNDDYRKTFLTTGHDATGDGRWEPEICLVLFEDYDYDGLTEAFFYVNAMRELVPRELFCVEMETMRVEWSLPVAPTLNSRNFYSVRDSLNPGVIFTSYNPKQGVADSNFSDNYGYLTIVNSQGEIIFNQITAVQFGNTGIIPTENSQTFFVASELNIHHSVVQDITFSVNYYISEIDQNGRLLQSIAVSEKPSDLWLAQYGTESKTCLYVHFYNSVVRVYSIDSLKLEAFSDTVKIGSYLGRIKLQDSQSKDYVFSDGLYSKNLSRLADFPFNATDFQVLAEDQQGNVTAFILNTTNRYLMAHVQKKTIWAILSSLITRHQFYILFILSVLLIALIIANSHRRRAVEKVIESEKRLKSVFENTQDIIYQTDIEGRVVWVSPSVERILGYNSVKVVGHNIIDFYQFPEKRDELMKIIQIHGKAIDYEVLVCHKDGHNVILSTSAYFRYDQHGAIIGTEGVARDITFRKKAEEEIRRTSTQLEQIFKAAAPLCVIDTEFNIQNINDTYCSLFKVNRQDEIGHKCYENWPTEICHSPRCPMVQILNGQDSFGYEIENKLRDGSNVTTAVMALPYLDSEGKILGIVENFTDITQRKIAEDALKSSEEKYRTLVESAEEAIFTVDKNGIFLFLNGVAGARWGGKPDELVGKTMFDLFPKDIAESQMKRIGQVFATGQAELGESITVLMGIKHNFRTNLQPIRDKTGNIVAVLGIASDITRFVQTQKELKSEREFVGSLLETSNSLVVCLDNHARITVFNKECERVTGYRRDEVIGKSWPDIFLPKDHYYYQIDNFAEWVKQHPEDKYEGPLITRSGEVRTILWSNSALFSPDSDELRAIAVGHDITERKKAEQALKESEEKFREIAELAPEGIFETDKKAIVTFANRQALNYFGYDKTDLEKGLSGIELMVPSDRTRVLLNFKRLLSGEKIGTNEYTAIRKDGSVFSVALHSSAIVNQGMVVGSRGVLVDISERKRTESMQLVLYKITNAVSVTKDLNELFKLIRKELGTLLDTTNFFIALYDRDKDSVYNPYHIDEKDTFDTFPAGKTMTAYVIKHDCPLLATREVKQRLIEAGEIETVGTPSKVWLGVPLKTSHGVIGAVVVQNYYDEKAYTERDLEILKFASEHIAIALERKKAEEALNISEHRYALATAAAKVGVWDWNLETGEFYLDPALKINLGYEDYEIPNNQDIWNRYIYPDDVQKLKQAARDYIDGKSPEYNFEHRMIHKDGSIKWILVRGRCIRNAEKKAVRMIGTNTDITDRKKGEEALRESEARFSEALMNSRDVLYRLNLQTLTYDYISHSVIDMTGYTPDEVITMGVDGMRKITHSDDLDRIGNNRNDFIASAQDSNMARNTEYRIQCKNGEYRWLSDSHVLIRDKNKFPRFIIGSVRDITEQKQAGEALLKSEEKLRAQYKSIPLPTFTWQWINNDFVLIDYNDQAIDITNGRISDFIGIKFKEMYPGWQEGIEAMWKCFAEKKSHKREIPYKYITTGKERLLDVSFAYVPPDFVMVHTEDITERKIAEAGKRIAEQEKYEQAKRTAGVFAHEIRNALFPANVAIERIKNGEVEKNSKNRDLNYYTTIAEQSIQRAVEITRLISAFTKIDSEKMPERVNIVEVVEELLFNNRLRINDQKVKIEINGDKNIWVNSNRKQLLLALNNMMINSLDALSRQSQPSISITWNHTGKYINLFFKDNGFGISTDNINRIFEPFFSTKTETGGTGIGLAIAKRIIEMYGGEIEVFSILRKETVFEIRMRPDNYNEIDREPTGNSSV